jgi:rhomboid protease GluP
VVNPSFISTQDQTEPLPAFVPVSAFKALRCKIFREQIHVGCLDNQLSKNLYAGRPSVCRNCGALVGAGEGACGQCGAPPGSVAASNAQPDTSELVYDRETVRFARAVLTRPYLFTIAFLIANFFVFLMMWSESGNSLRILEPFSPQVLIAFGAKLNSLIRDNHEYWRFVTPIFIHVNLVHLLVNMYSLWAIGPSVEKLYGSAKFVFFWVLTGVAGVLASYLTVRPDLQVGSVGRFLFKATDGPSAGASGALFGLVGVLFVFGIKYRRELPEGFKRMFGTGLLPVIIFNLFIGYVGRGFIDNAAHLGGFVAGAALALLFDYRRPGAHGPVPFIWQALQIAALLVVAAGFLMVERRFPARSLKDSESVAAQDAQARERAAKDFAANLDAVNEAQAIFFKALVDKDTSEIDKALAALDSTPHVDEETDAVRGDLKSLLARAKDYANEAGGPVKRKETKEWLKKGEVIYQDFDAWRQRYENWTTNEGHKTGVELIDAPQKQR